MSLANILTEYKTFVSAVAGVENVYKRRVVYADQKDFISKNQNVAKNAFLGVNIFRSGMTTELTAFYNKLRYAHTITIYCFYGTIDRPTNKSYETIQTIMDSIVHSLNKELTLNGKATDSEFPVLGSIDLESKEGFVLWSGEITCVAYEDEITGSIS